ncbi:MAG TPA: hypothetical protein GXZ21_00470 [Clostridiales bacterium]|nr:hypothetical protein [Clostridiales bacterium]
MVRYLFEEKIIMYIFAGLCGLGVLTRIILNMVYKYLVRETDAMGATKNKQLKHMKLKFETCYKLKIGVNNVDTFVDKNVYKHRFCGILLSTWENFCGQVLFLSLLLVPISAVFGVVLQIEQTTILLTGAVGILGSSILILVDKSMNLVNKKLVMHLNLEDYFENFCKVRLERETFHPDEVEKYKKEYNQVLESSKQISATALPIKPETKTELDRRKQARARKEEERRLQAIRRIEEQKKLEEAKLEEEKRRIEERKRLAAKRREEEIKKLEEERLSLEAKSSELSKKDWMKDNINTEIEHDEGLEEKETKTTDNNDMIYILNTEEQEEVQEKNEDRLKFSEQEEKLIEDILKEFFA